MSVLFPHSFNSSYLLSGRSSSAKSPNFKQNKKWKQGWNKIEEEDEQAEEESEHVESATEEDQDEEDDLDTDEEGNTPKTKNRRLTAVTRYQWLIWFPRVAKLNACLNAVVIKQQTRIACIEENVPECH